MVNEDIITSLKNAIAKGESLDLAISTAINSGYNEADVKEAAKFVGQGVIDLERESHENYLAMPNEKGFFKKMFHKKQEPTQNTPLSQIRPIPLPTKQTNLQIISPQIKKPIQYQQPLQSQIRQFPRDQSAMDIKQSIQNPPIPTPSNIPRIQPPFNYDKPKKQGFAIEILLLVILLVLIGFLIVTIKYKDVIIKFFSG